MYRQGGGEEEEVKIEGISFQSIILIALDDVINYKFAMPRTKHNVCLI